MPAIVRQTMSRDLANDLLTDIKGGDSTYFIGIGKSDTFNELDTVIAPVDSPAEEREFRNNLQSIKKVEGATFVAKRVNWSYGSVYGAWDDTIASDIVEPWTPWYVMNDAKEVYVCVVQGKLEDGSARQSTVEPNYGLLNVADYTQPFTTPDGYTWKFLYSITPERIYQFLSSNHLPIQEAESSLAGGDSIEDLQFNVKAAAVGGQIIGVNVLTGGSGFTSAPDVFIHGDGTGAAATASISPEGVITKIVMTNFGEGYNHASIVIAGDGIDVTTRTVITTKNGLGFNPVDDLKTSSIMTNIKPDGSVNGTFVVGNTFRQIGLIKDLIDINNNLFSGTSARSMSTLHLVSSSPFESGKLITGATSGAKAWVDESIDNIVYYHHNESTGFLPFEDGESVTQAGVVLTGQIDFVQEESQIDRFSGVVKYIENRARIRRDEEQQEDIKIVITV